MMRKCRVEQPAERYGGDGDGGKEGLRWIGTIRYIIRRMK